MKNAGDKWSKVNGPILVSGRACSMKMIALYVVKNTVRQRTKSQPNF